MCKKIWLKTGLTGMIIILTFSLAGCGNKAKSLYNSAIKNYEKGDYETSSTEFAQAIEKRDDYADYYIDYGYCLIALNDYEKASTMFNKAILNKDNAIVNKNNKKAYRGLGILQYMQGNYEEALKHFENAMNITSLKDYDLDILSYMGSCYVMSGKYTEAVDAYTKVLTDKPKTVNALIGRAQAHYGVAEYEECIKDYEAAKKIDATNYDLYFGLYNAYCALNKKTEADAILEQAIAIPVKDEEDTYNLAKVQYYQGNVTQALDSFKESSSLGYRDSYYFMGDIYLSNKDYASAAYYLEMYQQNGGIQNATFCNKLGMCYLETEKYGEALKLFQDGLKTSTKLDKQSLLRNEVVAYEYMGDYVSAYNKMQTYIAAYPEDEEAARDLKFLETRQSKPEVAEPESEDPESEDAADDIVKP